MKKLLAAIALSLGWVCAAGATAPAPLTTLRAIYSLTNAQASQHLPVAFEATVTYFRGYEHRLFVQDGDAAIYVKVDANAKPVPGDRVLIKGTTHESFLPYVLSNDVTVLHSGAVPKPIPTNYDELIRAELNCKMVTVRATVNAADLVTSMNVRSIYLQLIADGGAIDAVVDSDDPSLLQGLLDATVEVTGAASGKFDGKWQQTGVLLRVPSFENIKVLKRADTSPMSLPVTPMDKILNGYHVQNRSQRIRVQGTITYYQPGSAIVLQSGAKSLWIRTRASYPVNLGDLADVTGYPGLRDGFLNLLDGSIQDGHVHAPIRPLQVTWSQLAMSRNIFDLVSIEGKVVTEVQETSQDEYVLLADGQVFSAILRHPPPFSLTPVKPPPMKQITVGSTIRVTGICILEESNPINNKVPFTILLRSANDIALVGKPSPLTVRNLVLLVALLLALIFIGGIWAWMIEHKVRQKNADAAYIELRRAHILEDINGPRPLAEIIVQITELVSFMLKGIPCWCQISDGATLGECPSQLSGLRIIHYELPSHAGAALGTIFAAFHAGSKPRSHEMDALSRAAALATLAIETRRLYSDLLRRSDFDLLTNIHNRFSLDKLLEARIEQAQLNASIFGLIYIDLNLFKQVNDRYGHRIGDLYLQEAAHRMQRQLRPRDTLARIGGDEFAALIPIVRNRAEVEEIALRLEHCFDDPFSLEGCMHHGSASVGIALYPEDAADKEGLLCIADAAMYHIKNARRHIAVAQDELPQR